jgi:hypothetical protein
MTVRVDLRVAERRNDDALTGDALPPDRLLLLQAREEAADRFAGRVLVRELHRHFGAHGFHVGLLWRHRVSVAGQTPVCQGFDRGMTPSRTILPHDRRLYTL